MGENLKVWNAVKQPPPEVLREIKGGRLKGKTDISPQWRYRVMTETFGVCGFGWKYTVDRLWTEAGSFDQVLAFAQVSVYVKVDDKWSDAIPGQGGSMLIEKESSGLYSSDEGYKMAITDALSVAFKVLGVAADVYMGMWDGTKYANATPNLTPYVVQLLNANADTLKNVFLEMAEDFRRDPDSLDILTKMKDLKKAALGLT